MKQRNPILASSAAPHSSGGGGDVSRRDLLKTSLFGAAASWTIPTFLQQTIFGLDAHAGSNPPAGGEGGPIVLVIQLEGGNDGLNTVVPFDITTADDPAVHATRTPSEIYYSERPEIAIPAQNVLPLLNPDASSTGFGLHPALQNVHKLWTGNDGANARELAIVNGIGYPNPNLSHFTSTDFWHTAQPNQPGRDGWLGRFFAHKCNGAGGCDPQIGVNFDSRPTLAFFSESTTAGISTASPRNFGWVDHQPTWNSVNPHMEPLFRKLSGVDHPLDDGVSTDSDTLAYVQRSTHSALLSSRSIASALDAGINTFPLAPDWAAIPNNYFATQLQDIAAMIYGGLSTQIYYVGQGGYDTHADQASGTDPLAGSHANLLTALDQAIGAFANEMKAQGNWSRVLIFTISEFGRKVNQNGSLGTDHGAAAPMLVTGGGVNPGLYGSLPSLSAENRIKNDSLVPTIDFRRAYRTVVETWLGVPPGNLADVLPSAPSDGNFNPIPFVNPYS